MVNKSNKDELISLFENGDKPTGEDFEKLISYIYDPFETGLLAYSENMIDPEKTIPNASIAFSYKTDSTSDYAGEYWKTSYSVSFEGKEGDVIYSNCDGRLVWYESDLLVNGNKTFEYDEDIKMYKSQITTSCSFFKIDAITDQIVEEGFWFACKSDDFKGNKIPYGGFKIAGDVKSDGFAEKEEIEYLKQRIDDLSGHENITFFVPKDIYMYESDSPKKWINIENVLVGHDAHSYFIASTAGEWYLSDYKRIKTQGSDVVFIKDNKTKEVVFSKNYDRKSVNPSSKSNPSTAKNVLMIGDSLTAAGYIPCDVKRQITEEHGFTNFNFIGTNSSTVEDITCLNEGKGGYTFNDFTKSDNSQGRGNTYPNPFLNGGNVNMQQYMNLNSFSGNIDYCIIELGVNNMVVLNQNAQEIKNELKKLVDQILGSYPSCKIFVCGLVPISKINGEKNYVTHNSDVLEINGAYEEFCNEEDYAGKCIYVDSAIFFNSDVGYPTEKVKYRGSDIEYSVVTDWLHPSESGYYMMSDTISSAFIYHM